MLCPFVPRQCDDMALSSFVLKLDLKLLQMYIGIIQCTYNTVHVAIMMIDRCTYLMTVWCVRVVVVSCVPCVCRPIVLHIK